MKSLTVLIPTCNRPWALAVTLAGLCFQSIKDFDVIISDQSDEEIACSGPPLQSVMNMLEMRGHRVEVHRNLPRRGMAQQRQFLLDHSESPYSLFLDDDLILEPYVLENLMRILQEEGCGFAGSAPIGLTYLLDRRPGQQHIEFWEGRVEPETVLPGGREWERYQLHNAANVYHVQEHYSVSPERPLRYKVAWIGGCVLYDTAKLREAGGFSFWEQLPMNHCGEDVLSQLKVMSKFGGCGVLPSGVYHQELPTTLPDRGINAPVYLNFSNASV